MATTEARIRTKQPEVRRDQLLDAAEHLFATKGFVETTVADIAESAGVAKGTFYLYFPSKEHCVVALKERLSREIIDRFLAILAPSLDRVSRGENVDIEKVVTELITDSLEYAVEKADAYINLFHRGDTIEVDQVAMAAEDEITLTLTQAFIQLNELGIIQVTHPAHTARMLFNGVHWTVERAVCREKSTDLSQLRDAAVEMVLRTLAFRRS